MKKLVRPALHALALLLPLAFSAVECEAQRSGRNPWAFISRRQYSTLYFLKDSVVEEDEGMRVAWVRIEYKEVRQHGMEGGLSPTYNMLEVRYRFDCPGRRMLHLETRERMGEEIVHQHPAGAGAEWERPVLPAMREAFGRVC